jgi:Rhodopirellula transposase DDE domain
MGEGATWRERVIGSPDNADQTSRHTSIGALILPSLAEPLGVCMVGGGGVSRPRGVPARCGTGITITVCHFPPGTSKFNKIEHRLWSQVTWNWRGHPLTSLRGRRQFDRSDSYPDRAQCSRRTGRGQLPIRGQVSDDQMG